jgi:tyrosyl-tRNA synthetase
MTTLEAPQRLSLIRENLAEILNPEIIEKIVNDGGNPKVYWGESEPHATVKRGSYDELLTCCELQGTATTGRPHCGYFVPAIKIAQLLAAGCDVTILLADSKAMNSQ